MSRTLSVLWLLRDVSLPYLRRHRVRACLTLVGVVIGTHVVVAIQLIDRSVVSSFAHTVETIAGSAQLQVANASAGVPEELVARVASLPGVESAAGLVQGTLTTPFGDLTVFGVDLFGDQRIREVQFPRDRMEIPDELAFANALDSVAASRSFLARAGLALGARIDTVGPMGPQALTVRGALDAVGPAALFDGDVGVVDLPVAQERFGREGRVDQIDVKLAEGADPVRVAAELRALVEGIAAVRAPSERASGLEAMLGNLQTFLTLTSLEAILVGFFLIYQALRTAIRHRRRELAIARAIGFRRSTLAIATAVEAAGFGIAGGLLGALLGAVVADAVLDGVRSAVGAIYARSGESSLVLQPSDLALALALGVATALLAAWVPAREAARVPVIRHLRSAVPEEDMRSPSRVALLRSIVAIGAGVALYLAEIRSEHFALNVGLLAGAATLIALGFAGLIPLALRALLALLKWLTRGRRGAGFALAVDNTARDVERSRGTVAAIMVAFALVLVSTSLMQSLRASILGWVDQTLAADLYVGPSPQLPLPSGDTFSGGLAVDLAAIPGIAAVAGSRLAYAELAGRPVVLRTLASESAFGRMRYPVVASNGPDPRSEFSSGRGVLVSDNLAYRAGLAAGDEIDLQTPSGGRRFRIVAIVTDFTLDIGTITVDAGVYERLWSDPLVNVFYLWLSPGAHPESVRAAVRERLGGRMRLSILTSGEFKRSVADALDRALLLTYAVEVVAIAIAIIAVFTFFLVGVGDRRGEIGLLRAVALQRHQLERVFLGEAAIVGGVGGLMAVLYALPVSFFMVTRSTRLVSGWSLAFEFPLLLAVATVFVSMLTAVVAAAFPVRGASRGPTARLISRE